MTAQPVRAAGRGIRLDLRVFPRSPRTELAGVRDGRVLIRVTAPPVDSAANTAVIAVLSDALGIPKTSIRIKSGATSRNKVVEIDGVDAASVMARLAAE